MDGYVFFTMLCYLKEKVSEIEEQVRAAEHAVNQLTTEAQLLQDKQKEIVMKIQERKKTLKDKQVYTAPRRGLHILQLQNNFFNRDSSLLAPILK